ncbi:hypothetical protein PGUG_01846 [Meyerozyma guilliermondii ATCC 6260]|uniref:ATP-dependent RNA helicase MSS116, mitochondrial n=1 Tax=Meyerozyma guilliermondii (strain ATCC 6260 / CBS 566 / DSM 6381 / JCM 1539 / NBRC 10279 / NRRL Y-324) TaxID=294746 RepID=MS116_PICGU|nr:uncharacterized protein PGUG_01846 [Meyerozyma guilliermondii ATCC 6260]A5DEZ5.2 RecName: Full=ATP-dependent RNA helicase MSS116, mitochondrial; Flags: Precursor [Meyerozyma guilliermondii ATCC 6260]EDK37748.2 hypothetical protein PGUG_01846 [Meyerozyma guilliermondii ATCC 6260]
MSWVRSVAIRTALCRQVRSRYQSYGSTRLFSSSLRSWEEPEVVTKTPKADIDHEAVKAHQESSPLKSIEVPFTSLEASRKFDKSIFRGLYNSKMKNMTVVQQRAIMPMMDTKTGVVVRAKTGTGKTLAFALPCIQAALENPQQTQKGRIQALVVAPTRDLALQIEAEFKKVLQHQTRNVHRKTDTFVLIGGRKNDLHPKAKAAIVIATPGRLEAILRDPRMLPMFSDLKYRVYDEADRLLDQGFAPTLEVIEERLRDAKAEALEPDNHFKTALFSATVDDAVTNFAHETIGKEYEYINCVDKDAEESHENIHQGIVRTQSIKDSFEASFSYILNHINDKYFKAIVFLPTITGTEYYYRVLQRAKREELYDSETATKKYGSRILRLHGKMSQSARDRTVKEFRRTSHGVLVCTDVAARGLDFNDVSHVIQMCPSSSVADYIHKIGRTARAGARGKARIFISEPEMKFIETLQRERGIVFKEDTEYVKDETSPDHFQRLGSYEQDALEEFLRTFLGFAASVSGVYRFNKQRIVEESFALYRHILNDPSAKLSVGRRFVSEVLRMPGRDAAEFFDVPGGFDMRSSNDRKSKRTFMGDGGSRSDRGFSNDRYGNSGRSYNKSRSFDRNDRSYGNDRSYSNDRKSYGNKSYGDKSYGNKAYGDKSYGDKSYGDKSYGKSYGNRSNDRSFSRGNDRGGYEKRNYGSQSRNTYGRRDDSDE